jgi:glucosamine 6-phosphate synthetase-like amidotransferase/phosphosugar isomerase protein
MNCAVGETRWAVTRPLRIDVVSIGDGLAGVASHVVNLPKLSEDLAPIAAAIPLQWLAWQLAIDRGRRSGSGPRRSAGACPTELGCGA